MTQAATMLDYATPPRPGWSRFWFIALTMATVHLCLLLIPALFVSIVGGVTLFTTVEWDVIAWPDRLTAVAWEANVPEGVLIAAAVLGWAAIRRATRGWRHRRVLATCVALHALVLLFTLAAGTYLVRRGWVAFDRAPTQVRVLPEGIGGKLVVQGLVALPLSVFPISAVWRRLGRPSCNS